MVQETYTLQIVIVCDHAHVSGGAAQVAHASAVALARMGHEVNFFAAVNPVDPALQEAGVRVVCLAQSDMLSDPSALRAAGRAIWNLPAKRGLAELLAHCDPARSIVHVHGWSKALSPSVLSAIRRSGIPAVQTLHDYVAVCPNGALFNYVTSQNCPLRPMSASCVVSNCDARNYGHKLWRVARHATLLGSSGPLPIRDAIVVSLLQRDILQPLLPSGAQLHHLPNPVMVEELGPAPVGEHTEFMFVGRLSHEKGCLLFADAAQRAGVAAKFVGDGPERARIAQALPRAQFTGWLRADAVNARLRRARALVFPSLWYETFGLTVYEALANGIPPVVSDNTVSAQVIDHGVNGLLFRNQDADSLAQQLQRLRDPDLAAELGRNAYSRYWSDPLTMERHLRLLTAIYRRIVAGQAAAAEYADSVRGPLLDHETLEHKTVSSNF
jgi:glycosyltransferase involved in cell wall biosynthesis